MNAAALDALDQARRYYVDGVVNSRKRVATLTRQLKEAEGQLAHATQKVADLEAALAEAIPAADVDNETEEEDG